MNTRNIIIGISTILILTSCGGSSSPKIELTDVFTSLSCEAQSPNANLIRIIEEAENHLFETSSIEELVKKHDDLLDNIKKNLDNEHDGYRYVKYSEDFNVIMDRFHGYNITYCSALSRYNPELDLHMGNKDKIAHVIVLMEVMEERTLTRPQGFNLKSQ